jgi:hypothetical protein
MTLGRFVRSRVPPLIAAAGIVALALVAGSGSSAADNPLARAIAEQRQLAAESPGDPRVQNDLGNLLALVGDAGGAEQAYLMALELDPESATTHYNYGRLLAEQRQRLAARRQLKRAIELDPLHAAAHYHLAALYDDWGLARAARRRYQKAFALDPGLADPARNPHVVDNRRALAAQLLVWQQERIPGPTREYEQPRNIVEHVQPAPTPEESAGADGGADVDESPSGGGFARSINAPASPKARSARPQGAKNPAAAREETPAADDPDPPAGRVLNAGSLTGSAVNQVVAPGRAGGGGRSSSPAPPRGRRSSRFQPPRPDTYRPGPDSTGRIELELGPVDSSRWAIGA